MSVTMAILCGTTIYIDKLSALKVQVEHCKDGLFLFSSGAGLEVRRRGTALRVQHMHSHLWHLV